MGLAEPRVISVGGGKGGVGKSVVAANLATAMALCGLRVVLVDADLGAANQHTLFGIHRPGPTLQALLDHQIESLEQALMPTSIRGLHLIPGSNAVHGAANLNHGQKLRLIRHILALDAEAVVVDVGAGTSFNTLDLFDLADLKVVVVTPQLTSMQNAYAFLKGAVLRSLRPLLGGHQGLLPLFEAAGRGETARMADFIESVRKIDPGIAAAVRQRLVTFGARMVGNLVFAPREARAFSALSRMVEDFLGVKAPMLGHLASSKFIHASVNEGQPFFMQGSPEDGSRMIREIAESLILERLEPRPALDPGLSEDPTPTPPSAPDAQKQTQAA